MKIAFLCLSHDKFDYLAKLSKYYCSDDDFLFIHADIRVGEINYSSFAKNTVWLPNKNRKKTQWGTFDIVDATLELLKVAIEMGDFDRYILISGSDVPLLSKKTLKERLNNKIEYISIWNVVDYLDSRNRRLFDEFFKFHYYHILNYGKYRNNKIMARFSILLIRIFNKIPFKFSNSYPKYAKGSQWWCVSNKTAKLFLNSNYDDFKFMHAPDEKAFHTIYINNYINKKSFLNCQYDLVHGIHYIDWNNNLNFKSTDINTAISKGAMFARKVNEQELDNFINFVGNLS